LFALIFFITNFLDLFVEANENYHEYLSAFTDFDKNVVTALQNKYEGISYKMIYENPITADHIDMIHMKELRIQVWTVNDSSQLQSVKSMKPDFIQSEVY
jgi:glycerophosphoryl diester phosphodiesterase